MSSTLRITGMVALGVILGLTPLSFAASGPAGQLPSATVVAPHSAVTYHLRDMGGHMITATVPALRSPAVKVDDPAQGTVQATVMALDAHRNQARIRTTEGQTLVLNLPQASVERMRVGEHFVLQVAQRSVR